MLEFQASLDDTLSNIDYVLSKREVEIYLRPFKACQVLVEHCLVTIDGKEIDTSSKYYEELWFAGIYREVHDWYQNKYGPLEPRDDKPKGLITVFGVPRSINIPRTITSRCGDGVIQIIFPSSIRSKERPLSWLKPSVKIKTLPRRQVLRLKKRASEIAEKIRNIDLNFRGGEKNTLAMSRSIISHLSQAALLARGQHRCTYSLAMWEMHLACEKCIKCFLAQNDVTYPNTHDLSKLIRLAPDEPYKAGVSKFSNRLPSDKEAIGHRYLEVPHPSLQQLYAAYKNALKICLITSNQFKVSIRFKDASITMRRPPWMSQLE